MEIKNRLFPYPVLCQDNDDYIGSAFEIDSKLNEELSNIVLEFNIRLTDNDELLWLVREGLAEYIIHIECSSTSFRTAISTANSRITYRIPKSKINNELSLLGMIVAKKEISKFKNKKLNEDYEGEVISFKKGSILAYVNMPKIFITKNYEELAGNDPFFTVIKRVNQDQNEKNIVSYDINDTKIKILVDPEVYDEYTKYYTNPSMEAITNTLLVMPAIAYTIEVLRTDGIDVYKSLYWYRKIAKACQLQGVDFENDIINNYEKTSVEIAQQMLQFPINRSFANLSIILEE